MQRVRNAFLTRRQRSYNLRITYVGRFQNLHRRIQLMPDDRRTYSTCLWRVWNAHNVFVNYRYRTHQSSLVQTHIFGMNTLINDLVVRWRWGRQSFSKMRPTRRKSCRTHSFVSKKHFVHFSEHLFCSIRQLTCLHHVQRIISTLLTICTVSEPPLWCPGYHFFSCRSIYKDFIADIIQCARATSPVEMCFISQPYTNNELSG